VDGVVDHFLQVFQAGFGTGFAVVLVVGKVGEVVHGGDGLADWRAGQGLQFLAPGRELEDAGVFFRPALGEVGLAEEREGVQVLFARAGLQGGQGFGANAAAEGGDAFEADAVGRIDFQAEEGEQVFDFPAGVEAQSADDLVGDGGPDQGFLDAA
jgi:hypothetical protein